MGSFSEAVGGAVTVVEDSGSFYDDSAGTAVEYEGNDQNQATTVEYLAKSITITEESDVYVFYGGSCEQGQRMIVHLHRDDVSKDSVAGTGVPPQIKTDVFKDAAVAAGTYEYEVKMENTSGASKYAMVFVFLHIVAVSV